MFPKRHTNHTPHVLTSRDDKEQVRYIFFLITKPTLHIPNPTGFLIKLSFVAIALCQIISELNFFTSVDYFKDFDFWGYFCPQKCLKLLFRPTSVSFLYKELTVKKIHF
jgi:hypothetical protein